MLIDEWKSEIWQRPIAEIEPPALLRALKKVEARKHYETGSRMRTPAPKYSASGSQTATAGETWRPISKTSSRHQGARRGPA